MNRILVIAFLLASFTQTNGQDKFVPLDRNYRILVKTESNDPYLGTALETAVAQEIEKELPCVTVVTKFEIVQTIIADRENVLLGGTEESRLEELGKFYNADIIVVQSIAVSGDSYIISGSTVSMGKKLGSISRNDRTVNKNNALNGFHECGKRIAMELVKIELCPFKGRITISTIKTDNEVRERGNRCGKNDQGWFRETINKSNQYDENIVLDKKRRYQADGTLSVKSTDTKIWRTINSNCVLCATYDGDDVVGTDAGIYTNSDYTQTLKEDIKIEGLAPINHETGNFPATVEIKFDAIQGTYMVKVVVVSKKGTDIKSKKILNITACRKDDEPDEEVKNEMIFSSSTSYGPFKGKPTDKTLTDSKIETFTTKHDGGAEVSTYKVNFSFTR